MRRPLALALCAAATRAQFIANIVSYGAVGDGVTLNTAAFVAATADIASHGGGVLYVPPGRFLLSPFNMTSRMELRLDGATLLASVATDGVCQFVDWTVIAPLPSYGRGRDFPGPRYTSLLHGWNLTDVRITSNSSEYGVVDGQGTGWWDCIKNGSLKITPGHLVELLYSERIEIDHVRFVDSPFWNLHPCVRLRRPPTSPPDQPPPPCRPPLAHCLQLLLALCAHPRHRRGGPDPLHQHGRHRPRQHAALAGGAAQHQHRRR
jgi:polygalacturonase